MATKAAPAEKKISKTEIMLQATKAKPRLKPRQLSEYIKATFGVEMSPQQISTYKFQMKKRKGGKAATGAKRGRKPGSTKTVAFSNFSVGELLEAKKSIDELGGPERVSQILTMLKNFN
jgi:hypothetical protein